MKNTNRLWAGALLTLILGCGEIQRKASDVPAERVLYVGGWRMEEHAWVFKIVADGMKLRGQVFILEKQGCQSAPLKFVVSKEDQRQSLGQWQQNDLKPCLGYVPDRSIAVPLDRNVVSRALGLRMDGSYLSSHDDDAFVNLFSSPGPLNPIALGSDSAELIGNRRTWIEPVFSVSTGRFKGLTLPTELPHLNIHVDADGLSLPVTVWRVLMNDQDQMLLRQHKVARCLNNTLDWKIDDLVAMKNREGFRDIGEIHRDQIDILQSVLNQDFTGFENDKDYSPCLN